MPHALMCWELLAVRILHFGEEHLSKQLSPGFPKLFCNHITNAMLGHKQKLVAAMGNGKSFSRARAMVLKFHFTNWKLEQNVFLLTRY